MAGRSFNSLLDHANYDGEFNLFARGEPLDLTPEMKHLIEDKLLSDMDLLEEFGNDQAELNLNNFIRDRCFEYQMTEAVEMAEDSADLERMKSNIIYEIRLIGLQRKKDTPQDDIILKEGDWVEKKPNLKKETGCE